MRTIEKIEKNQRYEYEGSVAVTGSIEDGAIVTIKNGKLVVCGDVGANCQITLKTQQNSTVMPGSTVVFHGPVSCNTFVFSGPGSCVFNGPVSCNAVIFNGPVFSNGNNVAMAGNSESYSVVVRGNLGANSIINCSGDITIEKDVGDFCRIESNKGTITTGNIGIDTSVTAPNGSIISRCRRKF